MKPLKPWNLPRAAALCFVALAPWVAMDGAAQSASNATIGAALPCGQLKGLSIPDTTINIMKAEEEAWRYLGLLTVMNMDRAVLVALNLLVRDPQQRIISVLLRLSGHLPRREPETGAVDLCVSQDELATMANV